MTNVEATQGSAITISQQGGFLFQVQGSEEFCMTILGEARPMLEAFQRAGTVGLKDDPAAAAELERILAPAAAPTVLTEAGLVPEAVQGDHVISRKPDPDSFMSTTPADAPPLPPKEDKRAPRLQRWAYHFNPGPHRRKHKRHYVVAYIYWLTECDGMGYATMGSIEWCFESTQQSAPKNRAALSQMLKLIREDNKWIATPTKGTRGKYTLSASGKAFVAKNWQG